MRNLPVANDPLGGFSTDNILEAFLAGTHDGFLILDQQLHVLHFNVVYDKFHQLHTGKRLVTGYLLEDLCPDSSMNQLLCYLNKALKGSLSNFTIEYPSVNGQTRSYDLQVVPLKNNSGEVTGAGVRVFGVPEQKLSLEGVNQNEELLKTLIQNSTDVFILSDIDYEIQYISETVQKVLGYKPADLIRKNGLDITHPDDVQQVKEWLKRVRLQPEKLLSIEYRVRNSEGKWIWIENFARNMIANNNVRAIVMNLRNIQAKRLADQALVQSEQRLSLLLNNTEESFIILNSRLRIVAYNRAAQEHSPYFFTKELQSGISILDLVDINEMEDMINLFEKVFDGENVERETSFVDDKKDLHIYSHIYRPLMDRENELYGVFITSADITKRKVAEEQVKESEIRFKTITQESFDAVIIIDRDTRITYTSPSITNVLGYLEEDLIGNIGFDFIHPFDIKSAKEKFNEVISNPDIERHLDVKMKSKQGEYVWIEVKAKNMFDNRYVEGILVSLRNISDRKKAEEYISLSEQRFKGLVQSGADMISILDVNNIIQYSSPTVKSIIGVDPEKQKGKSILDFIHPDDFKAVKEKFDSLLISHRQQNHIGPYRFKNDEGKYFWLESTITNLLGDPSIKGIVINSRDVTARKKLTEDLAANTERLKTAQKIAKLGYFEYSFKSKKYFFSDEFYQILELDEQNLQGLYLKEIENVIHPEDRLRVKTEISNAILEVKDFQCELRLKMANGSQKVILVLGSAIKDQNWQLEKFSITIQDITDSKMAMLALQTLEGRFKSLFENSIDGIIISLANGDIISGNPAICKMLGYTKEEMVKLNKKQVIDLDSVEYLKLEEQRRNTGIFVGEIYLRCKDGSFLPAEVTSINMKDAEGNIYHSNIIRDITDKKKAEEEQKSLTQELVKNNQDLQQFSFITSHNLRAPVANLISLLSLYDKENPADEFNRLLIDKFEEATQQLNDTLNDLINVLVIKSNTNIEKETILFADIFNNVKKNVSNLLLENGGRIEADFSEVDRIEYNKIHLESIFLNLISNAIRYRSLNRAPLIKIKSCRQDKWVIVSFTDNGLGIDLKRYGDRIFGLYQRFHQGREGKGLGLYMVNSQVVAMGGKIEVESEPDQGTTFKIYFKS